MNLQLRRSFTSLIGNSGSHLSMAQSGSVVNLNNLGMSITGGEFSRSSLLVNSRRVRMIPSMIKANSSCCGFYKPMASAAAANQFCILRICSDMKFAMPRYEASASRFYSQSPRSLNKGDVGTDGSEGSQSSQRLKAATTRRKTSSIPKSSDSVAEVENLSAKQESKTKEVKKVTRSKKDSKYKKLSGNEAAESNSASSVKESSLPSSAKKVSSASSAKKSSSASKDPTLAKGETLSSAEVKENIAEDKQDELASTSKKGSTRKKSTKKEIIKPQEITDINLLVTSELKPLYPPSGKSVVVVESVTKAKVIQAYLGQMYEVLPSYGHVRDLAARSGSVRPDDNFSMVWEVPSAAWTHLKSIKVALSGADNLILASDPDREGEAIAWHIIEMLRQQGALHDNISVFRAVFHEITEKSIKDALQSPRHIDANLVHAYLARRALDYLIGFNISPVLWRKLPGCQSAGRVQSAALSLISDREMEIEEFKPQEYWSCGVEFKRNPTEELLISSNLTYFASKKLNQLSISSETEAKSIEEKVMSSNFKVDGYKKNKTRKNPPTPYITSTLQQDAANKLHFTATYTMKLAQKLYEGIQLADGKAVGLITYTRTDGMHISKDAVKDIQSFVSERYGPDFVAKTARKYKVKNAQEAHEAIRPTDICRLPSMLVNILDGASLKLYSLIWSRTMACLMEPAVFAQIHVDIKSDDGSIAFSSSCSRNEFLGYQAAFKDVEYEVGKPKESEAADRERVSEILNSLKPGDDLTIGRVDLKQHFTQPPPRFSEASLVKKLEELGIGRPSTYASTLRVLQDRNYITVKSRVLHPEFRGRMVSTFLSHHFSEVTDLSFTADMETELDNVSDGKTEWKGLLKDYWTRFSSYCEGAATIHIHQVEKMLEKTYENFLFASLPDQNRTCPSCSEGKLIFKVSRYGAGYFIGCDQHPTCKYIAKTLYGGEETDDAPQNNNTAIIEEPKLLGHHPTSNEKVLLKVGPYGVYVQLGEDRKGYTPKRVSLSHVKDKDAITVKDALELFQYPVTLGTHPKDGRPVIMKLAKVGFTIRHGQTIADLPKNLKPGNVTLEKALEFLSGKDVRRFGRPKGKQSVEEENISLLSNF